MIEILAGVVVPTVIAVFGAVTWTSDRNAKHIDRRFSELTLLAKESSLSTEKLQVELKQLELRLPREYITRFEFDARLNETSKKVDYLVEQIDSIKNILLTQNN
jgi:septal ring factor EnvC (AmiA/AmiB activator)